MLDEGGCDVLEKGTGSDMGETRDGRPCSDKVSSVEVRSEERRGTCDQDKGLGTCSDIDWSTAGGFEVVLRLLQIHPRLPVETTLTTRVVKQKHE